MARPKQTMNYRFTITNLDQTNATIDVLDKNMRPKLIELIREKRLKKILDYTITRLKSRQQIAKDNK